MLNSNNQNSLPNNRLQLFLFYDGDLTASFYLELKNSTGSKTWIKADVANFSVNTDNFYEYDITGWNLTSHFVITGVIPNGLCLIGIPIR